MYYIIFIHFSVDEHLGYFHVLAITKIDAMNIGGVCILLDSVFRQIYAQEWDCRVKWQLNFQFLKVPPYFCPY